MVNTLLMLTGILMLLSLLISIIRFIKGPDLINRTVAFDVLGIIVISLIGFFAVHAERVIYLDAALVYGLLSFLGILVIGRFIERGL